MPSIRFALVLAFAGAAPLVHAQEAPADPVATTRPDEMYIVAAHMDGMGYGEAANDDGSGTALVMELARILNAPGVTTERSIRFALWNNEETGLQGIESPKGSGRYPEPRWPGMIQHRFNPVHGPGALDLAARK
jgi:hypothetical protein